jgi:predicted permease
VGLPSTKYTDETQVRNFDSQLLERVQHLPGVLSAGLCQVVPFSGGGDGYAFTVEGYVPKPGEPARDTWRRSVTPDYFATLKIPLRTGRAFQASDTETAPLVTIVDEKLARTYWPNEDPLGKRLKLGGPRSRMPWLTVVGVVASVKNRRLDEDAKFYVYQPFTQWAPRETSLVIRTANDPAAITAAVRRQLAALDAELPLFEVATVEAWVAHSLSAKRLTNFLLSGLAATALLLAVLGIYGVMSLSVGSRTNEFGIRLALGATPGAVLRWVVGQGMKLALIGVGIGLGGAWWLTSFLESLLYGVEATDPLIFTGVALGLSLVALGACYIPARRATRVDPMVALRCD